MIDKQPCIFKKRIGPSGIHLFNRDTGLNILLDTLNVAPRLSWSKAPRQVSFAITNDCDLSCPHCYAPKFRASLALEDLEKWIVELDVNGCVGIGLGGGEPTLYPSLLELCSFVSNSSALALILTTHGHNLKGKLLDGLTECVNFFRISMDGIGSTYELIRGRSFDSLLDRICALRDRANFGINYLVNSKTIADVDRAVQIATDLGASEFLLIPEAPIGRGIEIDPNSLERLRDWVYKYQGLLPLSISERNAEGFPCCMPFGEEEGLLSFVHVDATGIMKRTSYSTGGVRINEDGIMFALDVLKNQPEEEVLI